VLLGEKLILAELLDCLGFGGSGELALTDLLYRGQGQASGGL
jgi:hypothetical protein